MKAYVNPTLEISAISLRDILTLSAEELSHIRVNEGDAQVGAQGSIGAEFWG